MVKAIFFDFDDTLYSYKDSNAKIKAEIKAIEHFCKKHRKRKLNEAFESFTRIKTKIKKQHPDLPMRGDRSYWFTEFLRQEKIFDKKLADDMLNIFWKESCADMQPYYDAEIILKYLKKKGYKLGVITNGLRKYQLMRLKAVGLYRYFDTIVTTSDVGFDKPHPDAFKVALKRIKVQAKDAVMIGDNPPRDILPANKLGWTTVWLRRGKRYYYPCVGKEKATYSIKNFLELEDLF